MGDKLRLGSKEGYPAVVEALSESECTIDANHPLAGKVLDFEVEVMDMVYLGARHCWPISTVCLSQLFALNCLPSTVCPQLFALNSHSLTTHPLSPLLTLSQLTLEDLPAEVEPADEVQAGDGVTFPQPGNTLEMHYTGTLASTGEKFDSSRDRGTPFSFVIGVGQVIKGWDEGVMKMSVGQRANLYVSLLDSNFSLSFPLVSACLPSTNTI